MKALITHQNFPWQFRHFATHLAENPEWELQAIGRENVSSLAGIDMRRPSLSYKARVVLSDAQQGCQHMTSHSTTRSGLTDSMPENEQPDSGKLRYCMSKHRHQRRRVRGGSTLNKELSQIEEVRGEQNH